MKRNIFFGLTFFVKIAAIFLLVIFFLTPASSTFAQAKISVKTRIAEPASSSQKEERERRFAQKSGTEAVTISVLKDEDLDQTSAAQSDSIDEVQFYIHIANNTKKKLPLLQIPTGIKEGTLNYIRVEGATGYLWKGGELVLAYVSLSPGASTTVTVTGLPLISSDPVSLDITPTVQDFNSKILSKGTAARKLIGGKRFSLTDGFKMGGGEKRDAAARQ